MTDHKAVLHGRCPVCGHYGDDCTGERTPQWFDDADLLQRIGERRNDPVFMERLRSIVEDDAEILQRLQMGYPAGDPQERIVFDHIKGEIRREGY